MTERESVYNNLLEYLKTSTRGKNYEVDGFIRPYGNHNGKIRGIKLVKPGLLKSEILIYKPNQIAVNGGGVLISKFGGFYHSKEELKEKLSKII